MLGGLITGKVTVSGSRSTVNDEELGSATPHARLSQGFMTVRPPSESNTPQGRPLRAFDHDHDFNNL